MEGVSPLKNQSVRRRNYVIVAVAIAAASFIPSNNIVDNLTRKPATAAPKVYKLDLGREDFAQLPDGSYAYYLGVNKEGVPRINHTTGNVPRVYGFDIEGNTIGQYCSRFRALEATSQHITLEYLMQ